MRLALALALFSTLAACDVAAPDAEHGAVRPGLYVHSQTHRGAATTVTFDLRVAGGDLTLGPLSGVAVQTPTGTTTTPLTGTGGTRDGRLYLDVTDHTDRTGGAAGFHLEGTATPDVLHLTGPEGDSLILRRR